MSHDVETTDWGEPIYGADDLRRGRYPPEIEAKVDLDDEDEFNTDHQYRAARHLAQQPNTEFQELEEQFGESRGTYSKVYRRYFGPVNCPFTFETIESDYGTYRTYLDKLRSGEIDDPTGEEITPASKEDILSRLGLNSDHFNPRDKRLILIGAELMLAECENNDGITAFD